MDNIETPAEDEAALVLKMRGKERGKKVMSVEATFRAGKLMWALIQQKNSSDFHIIPVFDDVESGEEVTLAAEVIEPHEISSGCSCHPSCRPGAYDNRIWVHRTAVN